MLKGKTTVKLTNINTNEEVVYEDNNMVTNFISDYFNILQNIATAPSTSIGNPSAYPFLRHNITSMYQLDFSHLGGGVVLFEDKLEEDADKYSYMTNSSIRASCSHTGAGTTLGNRLTTKTGFIKDEEDKNIGYKWCWTFNSQQANGVYNCISLVPASMAHSYSYNFIPANTKLRSGSTLAYDYGYANSSNDAGIYRQHSAITYPYYSSSSIVSGCAYPHNVRKIMKDLSNVYPNSTGTGICVDYTGEVNLATNANYGYKTKEVIFDGYTRIEYVIPYDNVIDTIAYHEDSDEVRMLHIDQDTLEIINYEVLTGMTKENKWGRWYYLGKDKLYFAPDPNKTNMLTSYNSISTTDREKGAYYSNCSYLKAQGYDLTNKQILTNDYFYTLAIPNTSVAYASNAIIQHIKTSDGDWYVYCYYDSSSNSYIHNGTKKRTLNSVLGASINSSVFGIFIFPIVYMENSNQVLEAQNMFIPHIGVIGGYCNGLITINNLANPIEKTEENTMEITYELYYEQGE